MKRILKFLYHECVMSTRFPMQRRLVLRALTYVLYPEFRRKEFFLRRKLRRLLVMSFAITFFLMVIEIVSFEGRIGFVRHRLRGAEKRIDSLVIDAKTIVYRDVMDSLLRSADYLRYEIYKETGMIIPNKVSGPHLVSIVLESRSRSIPLKIMLRVIKRESGFDSTAVNPTSRAWGYMQTVNGTFNAFYQSMHLQGGKTTTNNIKVGAARLKYGFDYWSSRRSNENEKWELALACYAMGDSLPRALNRVPDGVKDYVNYVMYGNN